MKDHVFRRDSDKHGEKRKKERRTECENGTVKEVVEK
jgi:hypothetical protein